MSPTFWPARSAEPRTDRPVQVEMVVGRYRPDRDGVSAYVRRLVGELGRIGVRASVTEWPGIRRFRPDRATDLVHVQFAPSAYGYSGGVGLLPLRCGRPVVTTLHEYGWWSWDPLPGRVPGGSALQSWLHRLGERTGRWDRETLLLAPASAALVVTGNGHADLVRQRLDRLAALIPIGANVERTYPGDRSAARRELGLPDDVPLVAFFGFVHPVKGVRYLIDAVADLRKSCRPTVALAVAGGWRSLAWPDAEADAFAADLRQRCRDLGLPEGTVQFTGFLAEADASRWLTAAEVAVLPFTHGVTGKSGSLLTCWAHDLPVVATDPPEGADPDVAGAVQPARVRDVPTLRDALARLLERPDERTRLVQAGRERMGERSWPAVATAHLDLYRRVEGRR
jgi:glycosyltransferase involved in cell wall biosynthesis